MNVAWGLGLWLSCMRGDGPPGAAPCPEVAGGRDLRLGLEAGAWCARRCSDRGMRGLVRTVRPGAGSEGLG